MTTVATLIRKLQEHKPTMEVRCDGNTISEIIEKAGFVDIVTTLPPPASVT